MKNLLKFLLLSLIVGVLFSACSDDKDPNPAPIDYRGKVVGEYPVKITIAGIEADLYSTLTLTAEGEEELKAKASVEVPAMGKLDFEVTLSSLNYYNTEADESIVYGYYYKILSFPVSVGGTEMAFAGTGKYDKGYDGKVYKSATHSLISLQIASPMFTVTIETGVDPDPGPGPGPGGDIRDNVPHEYDAVLFIKVDEEYEEGGIDVNVKLAKDSEKGFDVTISSDEIDDNITLNVSELKWGTTQTQSEVTSGNVFFKIEPQTIIIDESEVEVSGTGTFDGYDGQFSFDLEKQEQSVNLEFEGELDGEQIVIQVVTTIVTARDITNERLAGQYPVLFEIWTDDEDFAYETLMTVTYSDDGFIFSANVDASDNGIGIISFDVFSENGFDETTIFYNPEQGFYKQITFSIDETPVLYGNWGEVIFEGIDQYFGLIGYDAEASRMFSYPDLVNSSSYFMLTLAAEDIGDNDEVWLMVESAASRSFYKNQVRRSLRNR